MIGKRILYAVVLATFTTALVWAQAPAKPYGGTSPQDVMAQMQKAIAADDMLAATALVTPAGQRELATDGVMGLLMMIRFSDPDDGMPTDKPLSKAEVDKKRKAYRTAVDSSKAALEPFGLDAVIGKAPMAPETEKAVTSALAKADTMALLAGLVSAMNKVGPLLGMTEKDKKVPFEFGAVSGYSIKGDKATAKTAKETLEFVRIDGRWYLSPPPPPK